MTAFGTRAVHAGTGPAARNGAVTAGPEDRDELIAGLDQALAG